MLNVRNGGTSMRFIGSDGWVGSTSLDCRAGGEQRRRS